MLLVQVWNSTARDRLPELPDMEGSVIKECYLTSYQRHRYRGQVTNVLQNGR